LIVSVFNQKGGVTKTTTCLNLGAALAAKRGSRVLIVDVDAQCNASHGLGLRREELEPSVASVLFDGVPVAQAIRADVAGVKDLDLLPGSKSLANADLALASAENRTLRLREALAPLREAYEVILIDCPPSLGLLPLNAICASDFLLAPIVPQYFALEGLRDLLDALALAQSHLGAETRLLGLLIANADFRARAPREVATLLRERFGDLVFQTEIRTNVALAEAPSFGKPIFEFAPNSTGAQAYKSLAKEVRSRLKMAVKDTA
jgi:chromosome partitioning protein